MQATGLQFDRQGLMPAVIVDDASGEVLMMAFMNQEAFQLTLEQGYTHFFSRSRNAIWRKGEQSGNVQEVKGIFVNCEENSLLIRVVQHGDAACHEGYRSCYYRRLMPDGSYQTVAERIFDPATVYQQAHSVPSQSIPAVSQELESQLEEDLRTLYDVYTYLRENDLSEQSNTSRLLQERDQSYLGSRLADELQELADVQSGIHMHTGRQADTALEGSQVSYWLFVLATSLNISYEVFAPHAALLEGYQAHYDETGIIELRQECGTFVASEEQAEVIRGLRLGFACVGWACASAEVSPLAPAEFDIAQMRRRGLVE
ncbi:MAG TPA: phosphoribosyl-AMP cyclohydrolase [Ktedonobacteraceae bacterium]|jgi:phosphoribosyl-AMP cyclohydrolase|nr:phosphoribosyl-AMP cyclohydrolase [Ktedonobacteraceae bacterium]